MEFDARDLAVSAVFAFAAGLALWPSGAVYWLEIAGELGNGPTFALVGTVAVVVALAFQSVAEVDLPSFAAGAVVALAGQSIVALLTAPDVAAYVVWYALLSVCLFVGVTSVEVYRQGEVDLYAVDWA